MTTNFCMHIICVEECTTFTTYVTLPRYIILKYIKSKLRLNISFWLTAVRLPSVSWSSSTVQISLIDIRRTQTKKLRPCPKSVYNWFKFRFTPYRAYNRSLWNMTNLMINREHDIEWKKLLNYIIRMSL